MSLPKSFNDTLPQWWMLNWQQLCLKNPGCFQLRKLIKPFIVVIILDFLPGFVEKLKLHQFDSVDYKSLSRLPSRKEVATICEPYCELLTAAAANDVTALSRLKEQKADFYATDFYGHTVLHVAVANGALDAIKFILNDYPSLANNKDKLNRTAQMYAIELQYHEITSYLERFIK